MLRHLLLVGLIASVAFVAAGCATSTPLTRALKPGPIAPGARVLLMEPDVELYEMTAAGLLEPKADWTATAQANLASALTDFFAARQITLVGYQAPTDAERIRLHLQLIKLHGRVGGTIIAVRYNPVLGLPGKGDVFDWTLGDAVRALAEDFGADYALFVTFRDSYASAGRVATMVALAVLGVGVPGGNQVGFASLIDLKTGDVVWFNRLVNPTGDLRTPEPAGKAVRALLADLPLYK